MMKHKYNIQNMLLSVIGLRGLPYPGGFFSPRREGTYKGDSEDDYELEPEAPEQKEFVNDTRLYVQDALGRWLFMPVKLKHPDIETEGNTFELEHAVINVTGKKNIVETALVGRKGSVKELISTDDYKISIAAFIQGNDGTYPDEKIRQLKDIYDIDESLELICALTGLILDAGDKVVITDISWPATPGVEDGQAVKIELITDKPFELAG